MARVRQARQCGARRTDGEPCGGWAIVGGFVCMAHGGASHAVQIAAYHREFERRARVQFEHEYSRWRRELLDFRVHQIAVTAVVLDMPVEDVTSIDIVLCHVEHGVPPLEDEAPKMRRDRRFRLPEPPVRPKASVQRTAVDGTVEGSAR